MDIRKVDAGGENTTTSDVDGFSARHLKHTPRDTVHPWTKINDIRIVGCGNIRIDTASEQLQTVENLVVDLDYEISGLGQAKFKGIASHFGDNSVRVGAYIRRTDSCCVVCDFHVDCVTEIEVGH